MSGNEKTSKPFPIGITGLNFSKRITDKYSIFRKSGRLPSLIYLRLRNTKATKKNYITKKINIISLKFSHSLFKQYLNIYLKPFLSSWNLNKTGLLKATGERGNLSLRLFCLSPKLLTLLRGLLGDIEFINNFNKIDQAFHYQDRIFSYIQIDRSEKSQDQVQKPNPVISHLEAGLKLQTKVSREVSQISDRSFSASKSRQLPLDQQPSMKQQLPLDRQFPVNKQLAVEIISMGGLSPLSFLRKKDFQDRPVNTLQTWQFSHLNTASSEYAPYDKMRFSTPLQSPGVPHIKMRYYTLLRASGKTIMKIFSLPRSTGETIMNPGVTRDENENDQPGFSGESAFSGRTSVLQTEMINNQILRNDSKIIPDGVYPELDYNIYNGLQKTSLLRQGMSLTCSKEPIRNINIIPNILILKKIIGQDAYILSKDKRGIEKTTSTKTNLINHDLISLIHKESTTQNTDTAKENQKTLLETEKTISRKIINENSITDTIKERPIQGINMIADKVYKIIEKRIAIEKDRRGLF